MDERQWGRVYILYISIIRPFLPIGFHPIEIKAVLPHAARSMKDPVYKLIELTGTSTTSMEEAVGAAIKRAGKTVKNLRWFQVVETRGTIEKGHVLLWQVTLKVGFAVEG